MAYYLVDYENVKADGMYGVDQLGKKDCVYFLQCKRIHTYLRSSRKTESDKRKDRITKS